MEFGQLIEHNMRNIFLEKSYTKCGGETIPRVFPKKIKTEHTSDQQPKVLYSLYLLYAKGYRDIVKLNCRTLNFN